MLLYFLGLILIVLVYVTMQAISQNYKDANYYIYSIFSILSLCIISLFLLYVSFNRSYMVGTDGNMYYMFYWLQHYKLYFDPFINYIYEFSLLNNNFQIFIIFTSSIFYSVMIFALYKMKLDFWSGFFYFYTSYIYLMSFNVIRQSIAISLVFLGIVLFLTVSNRIKAYIYYFISLILAMNFHFSAILMLPLLVLKYIKISSTKILISLIFTTLFYFSDQLKSNFNDIFNLFDYYVAKYSSNDVIFFEVNKDKGIIEFAPILIQFSFLYYYVKVTEKHFRYSFRENFIIVYYCAFLLLYSLAGIEAVDRFQFYFLPSIILFYSMVHYKLKNSQQTRYLLAVQFFWIIYFIMRLVSNHHGIVPYTT